MTQMDTNVESLDQKLEARSDALIRLSIRMGHVAARLRAKVHPAHPEHLSKEAAADIIEREVREVERLYSDITPISFL